MHWIVGEGGLLGRSVVAAAQPSTRFWRPERRNDWSRPDTWQEWFDVSLRDFHDVAKGDEWCIWWCAGRGTVSSSEDELLQEHLGLAALMDAIAEAPKHWHEKGTFVFASSAGSVYAGCTDTPIGVDSLPRPMTAYGRSKLELEEFVRRRTAGTGVRTILARITNLYGPRQDLGKGQGLVSRVCSAILDRRPVPVFVSLGTVRNYVYASDAAKVMWGYFNLEPRGETMTSIVCSPSNKSVGEVLKMCEMITDQRPLVRLEARSDSAALSRSVFFDPVSAGSPPHEYTPFHVGVHRVYSALLDARRSGELVRSGMEG